MSKHLLPVAGVPMILHPLSLVMRAGIRDFLVITTPRDRVAFERVLGNGQQWGITIAYCVQPTPSGVPHAIAQAREWSAGQMFCVVLGDNIFVGDDMATHVRQTWAANRGAQIFSFTVPDPRSFGVVIQDPNGAVVSLEEKPTDCSTGARAVPGLYLYTSQVFAAIEELAQKIPREVNVTDVNRWYWTNGMLTVHPLGSHIGWCDAGTHDTLAQATRLIEQEEARTGRPVASPDEIAWQHGWITDAHLRRRLADMEAGFYAEHLQRVLARGRSGVVTTS